MDEPVTLYVIPTEVFVVYHWQSIEAYCVLGWLQDGHNSLEIKFLWVFSYVLLDLGIQIESSELVFRKEIFHVLDDFP